MGSAFRELNMQPRHTHTHAHAHSVLTLCDHSVVVAQLGVVLLELLEILELLHNQLQILCIAHVAQQMPQMLELLGRQLADAAAACAARLLCQLLEDVLKRLLVLHLLQLPIASGSSGTDGTSSANWRRGRCNRIRHWSGHWWSDGRGLNVHNASEDLQTHTHGTHTQTQHSRYSS